MSKAFLYVNSKGYNVTRHSYSGSDTFNYCARKYYLERVQGWTDKVERSSKFFGIALEKAVTFWHQHKMDIGGVTDEFIRLWNEHKDKPYLYSKIDVSWDNLMLDGLELLRLYAIRYPTFPYVVNNPLDFQVESNFEVFPDTKLAGIELTSYIDLLAMWRDPVEPIIIDIKTSGKDVPDLTVLDPQLRTYAWVKNIYRVGFLWFRKCGREIKKGDTVTLLISIGGLEAGTDVITLGKDLLGGWVVTPTQSVVDTMDEKFVGEKKEVKAARQEYIESNGIHVSASILTKQKVQFKMAIITPESADDIGRSIKRDIINIVQANEKDFWPMQSGVRFPNEKCPNCAMRGICANKPTLRDELVMRKQQDELDFGKESE